MVSVSQAIKEFVVKKTSNKPQSIVDTATNIAANLDALNQMALVGKIASIGFSSSSTLLRITSTQYSKDTAILAILPPTYTLSISAVLATNAKANANIARASLANSKQDYQRMQALNKDDRNVSDHVMLAAQATFKADQAKVQAAETEASNLNDTMRQTWGETLANEASKESASAGLQALLQHKEVLLLITLPSDTNVKAGETISVVPTGAQTKAINAKLVAASPQTDSTIQGRTYYFRAPAENLRAGMRVSVEMKDAASSKASDGVTVPASAVVWYAGKPWVYKKQSDESFIRLPISTDNETNGGWFNRSEQLAAGDNLVVNGAQLLLSEEFKYQIKNENQD